MKSVIISYEKISPSVLATTITSSCCNAIPMYKDIDEDFRYGAWFRRVVFQKELDADTLAKIPEKQRVLDENGKMFVTRSEVRQIRFGMPLSNMANKLEIVLGNEKPIEKVVDKAFEDL